MLHSINYLKKKLGVSSQTIRNYIKQGKIEATRMPNGCFYFSEPQIKKFLNSSEVINPSLNLEDGMKAVNGSWAFYLRSSEGNKTHLENQEKVLRENYPSPLFIFKDSASGLNENRAGLKRVIEKVKQGEITDIALTQKDRLSRFGNSYLLELFKAYWVEVHFLYEQNSKDYKVNLYDELMKDLMSLIASFSGKFYKLRSKENKLKLIDQVKEKIEKNA